MDELTLIESVQAFLDQNLNVPILTENGTEDSGRPVPSMVLDAMDVTDITLHNSNLVQVNETAPIKTDERYFRFYYVMRFDYLLTHETDHDVASLFQDAKTLFRPYTENPREFDQDVSMVNLRGGGGFSGTFVEDSESQMTFAFQMRTFHAMNNIDDAGFSTGTLQKIQNNADDLDGANITDFNVTDN